MVFLRFGFLSVRRVRAHVLTIRINHWAMWTILPGRLSPNLHSYWWDFYPSILQLKWLFNTTYKTVHSHCDYNQQRSIICSYYLCIKNSIFDYNLRHTNQPGFEPGSPGPKAAMLAIELHSNDTIDFCIKINLYWSHLYLAHKMSQIHLT